jgi:long-chain acyl-CoA synthetase
LAQSFGATTIIMAKFEPLAALELIEKHGVTHSQWVPTMFVRMLKLPQAARERFDFSSHKLAVHAAAPCPVDVKRQMIEWWGPILFEYYAGSEAVGITSITSEEWLQHPGSVGRSILGRIHVCDDHGQELSVGEDGLVYFERDTPSFEYHDDPTKTQASRHPAHANWGTMGDIGHVDTEGFLYLTDRKAFTIISGGVNIYPQAIEDVLVMHPQVADVGVIGVPDGDLGEAVKAVVELQPGVEPTAELAAELQAFARARLTSYMLPRSIDFTEQLPRLPTGKLSKQQLRDRYWPSRATEATTQCATAFLVSK